MIGSVWNPGECFNGNLTDMQIWNQARSQSQIAANMHTYHHLPPWFGCPFQNE